MKVSSSADTLKMIDHKNKLRVRIQLSDNRKYWEKWVSKNNGKWEFLNKVSTLDGVLRSQQEIIDNNYNNLFEMVMSKK